MAGATPAVAAASSTPREVVRLSEEPGSLSLYFHQNAYTPQGDIAVIYTPEGLASADLATRQLRLLVPGFKYAAASSSGVEVGRKSRTLYYQMSTSTAQVPSVGAVGIYSVGVDAAAVDSATSSLPHLIAELPAGSALESVNADETKVIARLPWTDPYGRRGYALATVDIRTGLVATFFHSIDFLNHVQASPTDPTLVLFCHEGKWDEVDRIWTMRTNGDGPWLMHKRSMAKEIAGHESFSPDGSMIWYDLQTPRSVEFWLAGVSADGTRRIKYRLDRSQWSVHYAASPDGVHFSGDGGGPESVADRDADGKILEPHGNGQWLYLFTASSSFASSWLATLSAEKLVDLSSHDYESLEPNASFSLDGRHIIFRSNKDGAPQVYMVSL